MKKLAQQNKDKVIDLLTERLQFERSGVQLYDSLLQKVNQSGDANIQKMIGQLKEHRDQEHEHEQWLADQIRSLGGDTSAQTDLSKLISRESKGIEDVVIDGDADINHLFHAMLTAELVDNAGWNLLFELADEAGDDEAKRGFKKRLHEEEEHLDLIKKAMEKMMMKSVLGMQVSMPTQP